MRGDLGGVAKGLLGLGKKVMMGNKADKIAKATRTSPADAIQWSGCKDSQTSADAVEAGSATGFVLSFSIVTARFFNQRNHSLTCPHTCLASFLLELCRMLSSPR